MSFDPEQHSNEPGVNGAPVGSEEAVTMSTEALASAYQETLAGLRSYVGRNHKRALALGDKALFMAASLPLEEEYGAQAGDVGVGLSMEVNLDPRNMGLSFILTHYRDGAGEDRVGEVSTSTYRDGFTETDLAEYDDDVAKEWFDWLYAATIRGAFKRREAIYRLPDDHPSKFALRGREGDESSQAALAVWLDTQANQGPEGAGE